MTPEAPTGALEHLAGMFWGVFIAAIAAYSVVIIGSCNASIAKRHWNDCGLEWTIDKVPYFDSNWFCPPMDGP